MKSLESPIESTLKSQSLELGILNVDLEEEHLEKNHIKENKNGKEKDFRNDELILNLNRPTYNKTEVDKEYITSILKYIDNHLNPKNYLYIEGTQKNKFNKTKYWLDLTKLFDLNIDQELLNSSNAIFGSSIKNLSGIFFKQYICRESTCRVLFRNPASNPTPYGVSYSLELIPREVSIMFFAAHYADLSETIENISTKTSINFNEKISQLSLEKKQQIINNLYYYYKTKSDN